MGLVWSKRRFVGRVKLSIEFVDERGEIGRCERKWRGRRWPWKKISSAGDKSMAAGFWGGGGWIRVEVDGGCGWSEMVKENSWVGDEEGDMVVCGGGGDDGGFWLLSWSSIDSCLLK